MGEISLGAKIVCVALESKPTLFTWFVADMRCSCLCIKLDFTN
jgi:hypothetical protein